jgi:hypothetical protein
MYIIVSPRLGTPGNKFEPTNGVNVQALIDGGLISTDKPKKSSKVKEAPEEN